MKPKQVLIFILAVFALLGLGWVVFPADGVRFAGRDWRFFSYERTLRAANEKKLDIDSVITALGASYTIAEKDTLSYYRDFIKRSSSRLHFPNDDYTWLDPVFRDFESAQRKGRLYRVVHYGDSQIEIDRITSTLRQRLQERFGGQGTGMFPAMSSVPSASVSKSAAGSMTHYTMYGDSTTTRAPHSRYGIMCQFAQLYRSGSVTFREAPNRDDSPASKTFSRVSLLIGNTPDTLRVSLLTDTTSRGEKIIPRDSLGVQLLTWDLSRPISKATLKFRGTAEIYGISLDGQSGVAVDNIPLRGCSGTIFTRISKATLRRSFSLTNTRLIILQFGGNIMPVANSDKTIDNYADQIARQIRYFQDAAPDARIIFIGPSDMGRTASDGTIRTWPRLMQLNDTLRATALSNGAAYWDMFAVMGGENSMARWVRHNPPYAGPDYIHFTPAGARIIGDALSSSILLYHDFYCLRRSIGDSKVKAFMK